MPGAARTEFTIGIGAFHRDPRGVDGFAAVDALVALVVLSMCLALVLTAAQTARRAGETAAEIAAAQALLRYLAETAPARVDQSSGRSGRLAWSREVSASSGQTLRPRLCRVVVRLRGEMSRRRYVLSTERPCPEAT